MRLETVTVMREGVETVINKSDLEKGEKAVKKESKPESKKEPKKSK